MVIIPILMLFTPGLIAIRILWRDKEISRSEYIYVISDYIIYSFLIMLSVYAFTFITFPERTVSFTIQQVPAHSHIYAASFVFKYSISALVASLILPVFVPWLCRLFLERDGWKGSIAANRQVKESLKQGQ